MSAARSQPQAQHVFEVRETVVAALTDADSPDPAVVAHKILAGLNDRQCRLVAEKTLPNYVRIVGSELDRHVRRDESPIPTLVIVDDDGQPSTSVSAKVAAIRDSYKERTLATKLYCGTVWKFLGDCTIEDLTFAAESRFGKADATRAEGEKLVALGAEMRKRKIKTVRGLSEAVLREVYGA